MPNKRKETPEIYWMRKRISVTKLIIHDHFSLNISFWAKAKEEKKHKKIIVQMQKNDTCEMWNMQTVRKKMFTQTFQNDRRLNGRKGEKDVRSYNSLSICSPSGSGPRVRIADVHAYKSFVLLFPIEIVVVSIISSICFSFFSLVFCFHLWSTLNAHR